MKITKKEQAWLKRLDKVLCEVPPKFRDKVGWVTEYDPDTRVNSLILYSKSEHKVWLESDIKNKVVDYLPDGIWFSKSEIYSCNLGFKVETVNYDKEN